MVCSSNCQQNFFLLSLKPFYLILNIFLRKSRELKFIPNQEHSNHAFTKKNIPNFLTQIHSDIFGIVCLFLFPSVQFYKFYFFNLKIFFSSTYILSLKKKKTKKILRKILSSSSSYSVFIIIIILIFFQYRRRENLIY